MTVPYNAQLIRHLREDWEFTYGMIADYLNQKGIATASGGVWTKENVYSQYGHWYLENEYRRFLPTVPRGKIFRTIVYPIV